LRLVEGYLTNLHDLVSAKVEDTICPRVTTAKNVWSSWGWYVLGISIRHAPHIKFRISTSSYKNHHGIRPVVVCCCEPLGWGYTLNLDIAC
jgi:predicted deacetylase